MVRQTSEKQSKTDKKIHCFAFEEESLLHNASDLLMQFFAQGSSVPDANKESYK